MWIVLFDPDVKGTGGVGNAIYDDGVTKTAFSFRVDPANPSDLAQFVSDCKTSLAKQQVVSSGKSTAAVTLAAALNK